MRKEEKRLWIGLGILILLTPLGMIAQGTAWGEWAAEELKEILGYVPKGLERLEGIWKAVLPDYSIPGLEGHPLLSALGYLLSAVIGVAAVVGVMFLIGKALTSKERR